MLNYFKVNSCKFINNIGVGFSGALSISLLPANTELIIEKSDFDFNTGLSGGAIGIVN
jgi:hypothetical protein